MASKITGIAVVFGCPGSVTIAGIASIFFFNQSADFSANHQVDEIVDEDNEVRSLAHSKELIDATLMFTPRADPGTNTRANAKESLDKPAPGSQVVLTSFHDLASGGVINGNWSYVGGWKVAFRNNGVATYEMQIKRSANNDITGAVT